jgi:hypothetical protein
MAAKATRRGRENWGAVFFFLLLLFAPQLPFFFLSFSAQNETLMVTGSIWPDHSVSM